VRVPEAGEGVELAPPQPVALPRAGHLGGARRRLAPLDRRAYAGSPDFRLRGGPHWGSSVESRAWRRGFPARIRTCEFGGRGIRP
jgi:hypothetical protein